MLVGTMDVLNKTMKLQRDHGLRLQEAMSEAFSDEFGFGSTDSLTYDVLCELQILGFLTDHKIER